MRDLPEYYARTLWDIRDVRDIGSEKQVQLIGNTWSELHWESRTSRICRRVRAYYPGRHVTGFNCSMELPKIRISHMAFLAGADPGGALGRAPTPGTEGPAPKARVPSSQGQNEGTLVSLEWLFNTIQA